MYCSDPHNLLTDLVCGVGLVVYGKGLKYLSPDQIDIYIHLCEYYYCTTNLVCGVGLVVHGEGLTVGAEAHLVRGHPLIGPFTTHSLHGPHPQGTAQVSLDPRRIVSEEGEGELRTDGQGEYID